MESAIKAAFLGALVAGGIVAYSGGNAQTAITTAETALRNNALFIPPLIYLLAAAAGYTTGVGEGNPAEGLKVIGQGKDPLSQALALGTQKAIGLSMDRWPQETTATLNFLLAAGNAIEATVTYVDAATGKVVSSQWSSLPEDTRYTLIGMGKITSVVLPAASVPKFKAVLTKGPNLADEAKWLATQQSRNGELFRLFNAAEPKNELSIGGRVYQATAESNKAGTTKVFDTVGLSDSRLDQEVWAYARDVAGGRPFEPAVKPGVWFAQLPDGSKVTLRTISESEIGNTGQKSRWTVVVNDNPALGGLKKKNEYEVKFK